MFTVATVVLYYTITAVCQTPKRGCDVKSYCTAIKVVRLYLTNQEVRLQTKDCRDQIDTHGPSEFATLCDQVHQSNPGYAQMQQHPQTQKA